MSLSRKIQLFTTGMMLFLLVAINAGIYFLFQAQATQAEVERLEGKAESIVRAVTLSMDRGRDTPSITDLLRVYLPENGMIRIINADRVALLTVTEQPDLNDEVAPAFQDRQHHRLLQREDGRYLTVYYPLVWVDGKVATLEVTESLELVEENLQILRWVLLFATLLILIPTIIAGTLLSRLILRPIHSLIQTMEANRRQGTFQRLQWNQPAKDELGQMVSTYNKMMDWMEDSFHKQEQFVSDASHELKTPLTVIESYASLLKRWGREKPEVREEALDAILAEAKRMKSLTHQMLDLARDDTHERMQFQQVDLEQLCRETVRPLIRTTGRPIEVVMEEAEAVTAWGDPEKLKQLLFILIDNALKYSEDTVKVRIASAAEGARIHVEDRGIGIPKEDQEKIFERFYRVDKARSRQIGGSGLGLSIAKRIVEAHQGRISLTSEEGKGTIITVTLPLHPNRDDDTRIPGLVELSARRFGDAGDTGRMGRS